MGSVQGYYYSKHGEVSLVADKQQNANEFLKTLHESLAKKVCAMILPEKQTLQQVVARVVAGYEAKQSLMHKIWECFLSLLQRWMPAQSFLSQAQELHYHAVEINKMDTSQVTFVPSSDPAAKLREFFFSVNPSKPEWIATKTPAEMIAAVFHEQELTKDAIIKDDILFETAACALKLNDLESAKKGISLLKLVPEASLGGVYPLWSKAQLDMFGTTHVLYDTVAECLLKDDQAGAVEIIKKADMLKSQPCSQCSKACMERCQKAGKGDLLLTALEETQHFDEIALYCIKYKDRKRMCAIGKKLSSEIVQKSVAFLLGEAKTDAKAYGEAYHFAKDHKGNTLGILEQIVKMGAAEYKIALDIIGDPYWSFWSHQNQRADFNLLVDQLAKHLIVDKKYDLLQELVQKLHLDFFHPKRQETSFKALIDHIYDTAVLEAQYALAIAAAEKPLHFEHPPETGYAEAGLPQRKEAYERLKVICKLIPAGKAELQKEADQAKGSAFQLLHDKYGFVEALS